MTEITIKISDDEQTLTEKFLDYSEKIILSHDCPILMDYVKTVRDKFHSEGKPVDILIKIKMDW
jgi:hypothetical protein